MKEEVKTSDDQLREGPYVYIYATIFDDYRTFKEFRFVTTHEVLSKTYSACSKLIDKWKRHHKAAYAKAINSAFRPKVSINDLCTSFLKYICCTICEDDLLPETPQETMFYVVHLHLDNDRWSRCLIGSRGILKRYLKIEDEFRFVGKSVISMTLPTKFGLLSKVGKDLLNGIFETIYESNEAIAKMTYGQFWDFLDAKDSESKEEFTKDEIDGLLNTLIFYDFITIDYEWVIEDGEKKCLYVISITDLHVYYDFLRYCEVIP
jgi:hypothetical protein